MLNKVLCGNRKVHASNFDIILALVILNIYILARIDVSYFVYARQVKCGAY